MAQNTWFYTFPNGKKYEIGIFHSLNGHVVIYCQGEIMVIDFNVKDDKEYSFFIENKLVKVNVLKESEGLYHYSLKEEDIFISKGDPIFEKKSMFYSLILFVTLLLMILGIIYLL